MNKIAFVGRKRLGILLKSFGIDMYYAENSTELASKLKEILKSGDYAIILTEEIYVDVVKDIVSKKTAPLPTIMMLPTIEKSGETVKMIGEVVEKAVGINILGKTVGGK
ncbi:V-type ATP synthase subunit F [Caldisericum exile]|uniref:V-type ATP synthase subunit F n=1 Tax=Caldisericum exile (strain DSM 21853 / NBRC 104410 / AZM16c01) TaxID=511051 RepID=A0A7U6GF70_CALEA|nr:V-type ATP synthase subunit F [Caldisericum exile]BAL81285.1 putative V-type ATP synthase subunit F [Caldisericum exile AZM16c01]